LSLGDENHFNLVHNDCKIFKILIPNLCSKDRKNVILSGGVLHESLFLKKAPKKKQLLLYDLRNIKSLVSYKKKDFWIMVRNVSADLSKFENPIQKRKRLFKIALGKKKEKK
jgi:hypothetical protein